MTFAQLDRFNTGRWVTAGIRRGLGLGYARALLSSDDEEKIKEMSKYIADILHYIVLELPVRSLEADTKTVDYGPCRVMADHLFPSTITNNSSR